MNADEPGRSLEEASGPERLPTADDRTAVRRRARRGRARRVAWISALVVALVAATTISVGALDSSSTPTVVAPGRSSAPHWSPFCARADRIASANDPSLADFHREYGRLTELAPSAEVRRALETSRPYVLLSTKQPPKPVRPALRTFDRALADHCGLSFVGVFKIAYAFLVTPNPAAKVTPIDLGDLQPSEMLVTDDQSGIWLMAPRSTDPDDGCELGHADPLTREITTSPLPACGFNGVAVGTMLYFESDTALPNSFTHEIRILAVDTTTRTSQVLDPIALQVEGSSRGHTQLAYGDGSLWIWGRLAGQSELHQVSLTTGAVERVITGMPQIGGIEPLMTATAGQLWLSGGPGSESTLARVDTATGALTTGPSLVPGAIQWLASRGTEVDVGVFGTGSSHVVAVAPDGTILHNTEVADPGTQAITPDGSIWTLGSTGGGARVPLQWIDTSTFTPKLIHTFSGSRSCTASAARHLAAVGPHVFVLDQGLYRVTS